MLEKIEDIYAEAFEKELERRKGGGYAVIDKTNRKTYYEKGGFYLCGFASLNYSGRNRALTKELRALGYEVGKAYYGGMSFRLNRARWHSNGFFEIMLVGYEAVADYLNGLGHNVRVDSRLD